MSHSGAAPFFDDVWQHVSSFIPISEIPTFRSVCHCFAARSFNDRFFKAVEFRNIAFISYLKSSLESQVEITHTKDMNQEDISNALKEEFPYCIQKSGHEEHANQREFKPFLFDFKLTNKGDQKL